MSQQTLSEPVYITAGKARVAQLEEDLAAAKASLQQDQADWKASLDGGFTIEKDIETAGLIETLASVTVALAAAEAKLVQYSGEEDGA
jgi:hypothetical protein